MTSPEAEQARVALEVLDSVGTIGLALIVYLLLAGKLVTRREFDREVARANNIAAHLERVLIGKPKD